MSERLFHRFLSPAAAALAMLALAACAPSPHAAKAGAKSLAGARAAGAPVGEIVAGRPVTGTLARGDSVLEEDSSFVDSWRYAGEAGERVTITLSSKAFDAYLAVNLGGQVIATNDDLRGGGTNARVTLELPVTGVYTVDANSVRKGETGLYTLSVNRQAAPPATDWAATYRGGGDPAGRYAVIVGIDKYPESLHGDLDGPAADARVMRQLLLGKYGFRDENVLLITDRDATRERILQAA
ncbi:MAG TPA: caspase family protein, partial [Longimicrobium sp.]|nr:caspase family protein [Longimicrobium sp.]